MVFREPKAFVSPLIVAFDPVTEEYREVPMPGSNYGDFAMGVGVLGGSLCVVFNYSVYGRPDWLNPDYVVIWVMKEYGIKQSWTKLCTVACMFVAMFLAILVYNMWNLLPS